MKKRRRSCTRRTWEFSFWGIIVVLIGSFILATNGIDIIPGLQLDMIDLGNPLLDTIVKFGMYVFVGLGLLLCGLILYLIIACIVLKNTPR